jgi:hypothetical protein
MKKLLIKLLEKLTEIKVTGPHEWMLREIQGKSFEIFVVRTSEETRYAVPSLPIAKAEQMAKEIGLLCLQNGAIDLSAYSNAVEMKLMVIRPVKPADFKDILNTL